jgi:hypothetical protein
MREPIWLIDLRLTVWRHPRLYAKHLWNELAWTLAWWIPARVSLYAFVRVHSMLDYCPESYGAAYAAFVAKHQLKDFV